MKVFITLRNAIEEALLEKRMMCDIAVFNQTPIMHAVTDLKACYNRQLPNLCGLIEESVRIDRNVIKLIMKIIPIMEHHVCTRHGMSKEKYGGVEDSHAETRARECNFW